MGVCDRSDIFQEKISDIFNVFDTVHAYIGNAIVIYKHDLIYQLKALYKVL